MSPHDIRPPKHTPSSVGPGRRADELKQALAVLAQHPLCDQASKAANLLAKILDDTPGTQSFPAVTVRPIEEDGSVSVEVRSTDWRLLVSIELDDSESGWSLVFSPRYGSAAYFGVLSDSASAIRPLTTEIADYVRDYLLGDPRDPQAVKAAVELMSIDVQSLYPQAEALQRIADALAEAGYDVGDRAAHEIVAAVKQALAPLDIHATHIPRTRK